MYIRETAIALVFKKKKKKTSFTHAKQILYFVHRHTSA